MDGATSARSKAADNFGDLKPLPKHVPKAKSIIPKIIYETQRCSFKAVMYFCERVGCENVTKVFSPKIAAASVYNGVCEHRRAETIRRFRRKGIMTSMPKLKDLGGGTSEDGVEQISSSESQEASGHVKEECVDPDFDLEVKRKTIE